jgi:hypothetical protein
MLQASLKLELNRRSTTAGGGPSVWSRVQRDANVEARRLRHLPQDWLTYSADEIARARPSLSEVAAFASYADSVAASKASGLRA